MFPKTLESSEENRKGKNAETFALICDGVIKKNDLVNIRFVSISTAFLTIDTVECADESEMIAFPSAPFHFPCNYGRYTTVSSLRLKKITSNADCIMDIQCEVSKRGSTLRIRNCSFEECNSCKLKMDRHCGALYVDMGLDCDPLFSHGTSFSSCKCDHGYSGGLHLSINNPSNGTHLMYTGVDRLIFEGCAAGTGLRQKNTGFYLSIIAHDYIRDEYIHFLKVIFPGFKRPDNEWMIIFNGYDITTEYIDPPTSYLQLSTTTTYLKVGGRGDGGCFDSPKGSFFGALNWLSGGGAIKIIKDAQPLTAIAFSLNEGRIITIEGIGNSNENNEEAEINCDVHPGSNLFTCYSSVVFQYLGFMYPKTLDSVEENGMRTNAEPSALIYAGGSGALNINNCRFIRPAIGEDEAIEIHLVKMDRGHLSMNFVELLNAENSSLKISRFEALITIVSANKMDFEENEEEHFSCRFDGSNATLRNCTSEIESTIFANSSIGALSVVGGYTQLTNDTIVGNTIKSADYSSVQRNVMCENGELTNDLI
ncbi:uncharacterized protein MONOS_14906 [Monocercomonoides exilis]|uniref:uncharacterized protein n=1 Tax=Monocercomonoides exilis TaxID=2049356 RepID=UPI0035598393|nr:hypothetical protein MONOS_14906 [Monocercomonoides exilis]|eukprot:MONOS_14906.1-p1 / transcript=MONOS_14906.1 / gene=MONOS_14906 / organism=Monocercomonoides_exilis_PA203 / gene_product=unspecified product / transcript_product=unspecified product / location=Mono_scaffold01103:2516-4395(-) / protein_length=538 / sequence_SO=supercontig / SO=protein_coding / is_pseudo=false